MGGKPTSLAEPGAVVGDEIQKEEGAEHDQPFILTSELGPAHKASGSC